MPNANASPAAPDRADPPTIFVRARRTLLLAAGLATVAFTLAAGHVPCGFARVFHMPCPGCGSTRAMIALASGDLHGFLRHNPLAPFMTLIVVVLAFQALSSMLTTGSLRRVGDGAVGALVTRGVLVVAVFEVALWLARFGGLLGGPVPV
jgi:hypothetical protein